MPNIDRYFLVIVVRNPFLIITFCHRIVELYFVTVILTTPFLTNPLEL